MFRRTASQSSSVWYMGLPRYRKFSTFSILSSPSLPSILKYIPPHVSDISTSLCRILLSIALWHLSDCLCFKIMAAVMCMPHWSHCGNGSGPSFMMSTFDFQCRYMKFSLSLPRVFALAGHTSTGHSTDFRIRRNGILYISVPPSPTSTPLTRGSNIPCDLSILCQREEAASAPQKSSQPTLVLFLSWKVAP